MYTTCRTHIRMTRPIAPRARSTPWQTEAERTAWRLAGELGLPLSTVLPNFVMGPVAAAQAAAGISVGFFKVRGGTGGGGSGRRGGRRGGGRRRGGDMIRSDLGGERVRAKKVARRCRCV